MNERRRKRFGAALLFLTFLFALRVLGQLLVAALEPGFLPAMEQWYSGLIPYPVLLPIQLVMIAVMVRIVVDVTRGTGRFTVARPRLGWYLKGLAWIYFLSMVIRYVVTMSRHPELRWFGHTIPIWFHMVLAGFVHVYGTYHSAGPDAVARRKKHT